MGQAKQRGTIEERAAQAIARIEAIKPKFIVCNNCQAEITDVHVMDSRGMVGIDGAFAGMCDCGHSTWAMAGDREAVATAMMSLDEVTGGESVLGSLPIRRN
jgi:hypothetical protein